MPRTLTAAARAAFRAAYVRPVDLVEIDLPSGFLYLHNRIGPLQHDGNTYVGLGALGSISAIVEGSDLASAGVVLELTGIPSGMIASVLGEYYQGRPVRIWRGAVGDDGRIVTSPIGPILLTIDTAEITIGSVGTIRLACESRDALWNKASGGTFTNADQQARHPGDRFFEFVPEAADVEIVWPAVSNAGASKTNHPRTSPGGTYHSAAGSNVGEGGGDVDGPSGPAGDGAEG